jgi:hypothetical protein
MKPNRKIRDTGRTTMLKKILVNNLIALLFHLLSIVLFFETVAMLTSLRSDEGFVVIACITIILYVSCGFILKPVEKLSFLSVVSVAIVLAVILVTCIWSDADEYGEIVYLYFNPILFPLTEFVFREPKTSTYHWYLLSPVYPSLLMYLGMVIRRLALKRKD